MSVAAERGSGWLKRLAAAFAEGIGLAFARFPAASIAILAFSAVSSLSVEGIDPLGADARWRLLAALATAGAGATAVALFGESVRMSTAVRALFSFATAITLGMLVWFGRNIGVFEPPLVAAAILVIPLAPHLVRSNALRFWTFLHWGFFDAALAFVSVLLFVVGVSAILEMVRYLFGIGIPSYAYEHVYTAAATLVGPLFALGRIPQNLTDEVSASPQAEDRVSGSLRILQNWIVVPLVIAITIVLHAYAAKIVVTGDVPRNQIGWIVGSFVLFALCVRVAVDPFLPNRGYAIGVWGRIWAPALLLPTALLVYALNLRVGSEGITGERYFLALAALSVVLMLGFQVWRRSRGDIRAMVAVPIVLLALSSFGPWGVAAMTGRSQIDRLVAEAPLNAGRFDFGGLDETARNSARSRIEALADVDALDDLAPYLAPADRRLLAEAESPWHTKAIADGMGLSYRASTTTFRVFSGGRPAPFDVAGYDTVFTSLTIQSDERFPSTNAGDMPVFRSIGEEIAIRYRGTSDRIARNAFTDALPATEGSRSENAAPFAIDLRTAQDRSLRFLVRSASFAVPGFDRFDMTFDLAVRAGEWEPAASLGGDGNR